MQIEAWIIGASFCQHEAASGLRTVMSGALGGPTGFTTEKHTFVANKSDDDIVDGCPQHEQQRELSHG